MVSFPHIATQDALEIRAGQTPSERLYGFIELADDGWRVTYWDAWHRWKSLSLFVGSNSTQRRGLRKLFGSLFSDHDCVIIKDDFRTLVSFEGRRSSKPVVYLDSMFELPRSLHRRFHASVNLKAASRIVCYSRTQADLWIHEFRVPAGKIEVLPYCIDQQFYKSRIVHGDTQPVVLAVGRDLGRDFLTLARALEGSGMRLILVTLPYLLPSEIHSLPYVEVRQRIPYSELFELYSQAMCVVVPLKGALTYPSGIRAVMESLVLGKATISTDTPVLREYFGSNSGVQFVPAGDVSALRQAIGDIVGREERRKQLEDLAPIAMEDYDIKRFASEFGRLITMEIER